MGAASLSWRDLAAFDIATVCRSLGLHIVAELAKSNASADQWAEVATTIRGAGDSVSELRRHELEPLSRAAWSLSLGSSGAAAEWLAVRRKISISEWDEQIRFEADREGIALAQRLLERAASTGLMRF